MKLPRWRKDSKTTYEEALKLKEPETRVALTRILTNYIHQRIFWLLEDLGQKEFENEEIWENIEKFVVNATKNLAYDETKEILLGLLQNQRLSPNGNTVIKTARKEIVEIIAGAMNSINLWRPKFSRKEWKRIIQVAK